MILECRKFGVSPYAIVDGCVGNYKRLATIGYIVHIRNWKTAEAMEVAVMQDAAGKLIVLTNASSTTTEAVKGSEGLTSEFDRYRWHIDGLETHFVWADPSFIPPTSMSMDTISNSELEVYLEDVVEMVKEEGTAKTHNVRESITEEQKSG